MHDEPWKLAPQLKREYIQDLAHLLVQVRGEVIDRHEPELGDTRLSLGMRAYECCRTRIKSKSHEGEWPWLNIITDNGRFTFSVEGIPVRFSRNDPQYLPDRKIIPSHEGYEQMCLFEQNNDFAHIRWFLIIDTPYDTAAEHAYFVGYNEFKEIVCKWEIPLSDQLPVMSIVDKNQPQAVKTPPVKAKLKLVSKQKDKNENDR